MARQDNPSIRPPAPRFNNEAGRIAALFQALADAPHDKPLMGVWWELFGFHPKKYVPEHRCFFVLSEKLSEVNRSLDNITNDISRFFPDDVRLFTGRFGALRSILFPADLRQSKGASQAVFSDGVLNDLQHCARELPEDQEITRDEFTAVYQSLVDLIETIKATKPFVDSPAFDGSISEEERAQVRASHQEAQRWLIQLARDMLKAMDEYELCGRRAFAKAWKTYVGEVALRYQDYAAVKREHPEINKVFGQVQQQLVVWMNAVKAKSPRLMAVGSVLGIAFGTSVAKRLGETAADLATNTVVELLASDDDASPPEGGSSVDPIADGPQTPAQSVTEASAPDAPAASP